MNPGHVVRSAFFLIPSLGPRVVAGPLVRRIIGVLEGAIIVSRLSVVDTAPYGLDIPKDSILRYETALKANKFVLIVRGTIKQASQAKNIISQIQAEVYKPSSGSGKRIARGNDPVASDRQLLVNPPKSRNN